MDKENLQAMRAGVLQDLDKLQEKKANIEDQLRDKAQRLHLINERIKEEENKKWVK